MTPKEQMEKTLNPIPEKEFDPATFDPMRDHPDFEELRRTRSAPPRVYPRMKMWPKKILEGQMVGMFESKQDLYLLIACLSERVSDLEETVRTLRPQGTSEKKTPQ